jgi:aspartate/methionine/tyrosine aminotransferase
MKRIVLIAAAIALAIACGQPSGSKDAAVNPSEYKSINQDNMQRVRDFLHGAGVYFLATVDGDAPQVRPFGTAEIIERMEKLQAIMALRCPGYNQAVFFTWFAEPAGWMEARVAEHQRIRDDIMKVLNAAKGVSARPTDGGSYLFVEIPELEVSLHQFIRIVREMANVTLTPGTEFGPQFLHQFRINFSQDKTKAVDAMKRVFAVMDRYRK